MTGFMIDSFSGAASELKGKSRTSDNVLTVLRKHPRVSTWDLSEHRWLFNAINDLKVRKLIVELDEPYPWHRFKAIDQALSETGRVP